MDLRVNTSARAGVAAGGAARSSGGLRRGVANVVARAGAATLESVVETEPVTGLVRQALALVVVGSRTAGNRRVEDDNAVVLGVACVVGGEGSITKKSSTGSGRESNCVDVEGSSATLAESSLHRSLVRGVRGCAGEPVTEMIGTIRVVYF